MHSMRVEQLLSIRCTVSIVCVIDRYSACRLLQIGGTLTVRVRCEGVQ